MVSSVSARSSLCTTFSDIGLGSDSVCARPSSHRIKSFDSLGAQPSHSRTSKLFQGQYRSLVSWRELVFGICWGRGACAGVSRKVLVPLNRALHSQRVLWLCSCCSFIGVWCVLITGFSRCLHMTAFERLVYFGGYILRLLNLLI